jgi:hypothetical protein
MRVGDEELRHVKTAAYLLLGLEELRHPRYSKSYLLGKIEAVLLDLEETRATLRRLVRAVDWQARTHTPMTAKEIEERCEANDEYAAALAEAKAAVGEKH